MHDLLAKHTSSQIVWNNFRWAQSNDSTICQNQLEPLILKDVFEIIDASLPGYQPVEQEIFKTNCRLYHLSGDGRSVSNSNHETILLT